jgi:RimJ/RimL family protein N-acetyltransferase
MSVPSGEVSAVESLGVALGLGPVELREFADHKRDLELDSIQRLELISWLAQRGVDVDAVPPGQPRSMADILSLLDSVSHVDAPRRADQAWSTRAAGPGARPTRLSDGRFTLRPVTADYINFLYELAISEEVGFRWRFRGAVPSQETFRAGLWQGVLAQFVVTITTSGEPVGVVVAYNAESTQGIAYLAAAFTPQHLLTGFPVGVVDLFVRYIFQVWNLRKLYMETPEFNYELIASGAGRRFDIEGRLRDYSFYDGRFWDEYILAISRDHLGVPGAP